MVERVGLYFRRVCLRNYIIIFHVWGNLLSKYIIYYTETPYKMHNYIMQFWNSITAYFDAQNENVEVVFSIVTQVER